MEFGEAKFILMGLLARALPTIGLTATIGRRAMLSRQIPRMIITPFVRQVTRVRVLYSRTVSKPSVTTISSTTIGYSKIWDMECFSGRHEIRILRCSSAR